MTNDSENLRLLRQIALSGRNGPDQPVSLSRMVVATLVKEAFAKIFDEKWYLSNNPDVAKAIRKNVLSSAMSHFAMSGIYEGRLPCSFPLDEENYLQQHQDVARSIESGELESAAEHFFRIGYLEGRNFKLRA